MSFSKTDVSFVHSLYFSACDKRDWNRADGFLHDQSISGLRSEQMQPLFYLYSALTGGSFTLITIVLSINQLAIPQQLDEPGGLREEIQDANAYRESALETLDQEMTPNEFLEILLISTQKNSTRWDLLTQPVCQLPPPYVFRACAHSLRYG